MARSERDDRGVTATAKDGFEEETAALRSAFGDLPMLLAGVVGPTVGWRVAPYAPAPPVSPRSPRTCSRSSPAFRWLRTAAPT